MRNIKSIKKQLEQRLRELGARVDEIEGDLRTPRSASWEDRATEIEGDEVLGALEGSAVGEIDDIRAALKRIEDGSYGVCSRCGEDIDERRLKALPYATVCIQCARSASS